MEWAPATSRRGHEKVVGKGQRYGVKRGDMGLGTRENRNAVRGEVKKELAIEFEAAYRRLLVANIMQ